LPKSLTYLGNFCKGVKNYHFSSEIIFAVTFIDNLAIFSGHTSPAPSNGAKIAATGFEIFSALVPQFDFIEIRQTSL